MSSSTRFTVTAALGAALVALATAFIKIPIPTGLGYVHLGDGLIYGMALARGPVLAGVAGAVGSGLADLLAGYPAWIPWSAVIKGVTGYLVGFLRTKRRWNKVPAMFAGAVVTVAGYSLGAFVLYGPAAVAAEFMFDLIQTGSGIAVGAGICRLLEGTGRKIL